ncbi:MAG: PilZ domain-containing protein [Magnetococcales bacterium]|nr:PilZ domain-containing protein [Magnetococcales bacterium]
MSRADEIDRRSSLRVSNTTPGEVVLEGSDQRIAVDVDDLGVSGFKIITDQPIADGEVTFYIEGEGYLCEVVHRSEFQGRHRIGLKIAQWLGWEDQEDDDDLTVVLTSPNI